MRGSLLGQKYIFFSEGKKKFVQRWKKCIEKHGDYVEKLCYCKFSIFIEIKFISVVRIIIDSTTYYSYVYYHGCLLQGRKAQVHSTLKVQESLVTSLDSRLLKYWKHFCRPHPVKSQNTLFFTFASLGSSNLTN